MKIRMWGGENMLDKIAEDLVWWGYHEAPAGQMPGEG